MDGITTKHAGLVYDVEFNIRLARELLDEVEYSSVDMKAADKVTAALRALLEAYDANRKLTVVEERLPADA